MDFLHCNKCFIRKSPSGYLISSCFHIFCQKCVHPDHKHCQMCNKSAKIVRLDGSISAALKMYFSDPVKYLNDQMEKLSRKMEFQSSIRIHLIKHLSKEKEKKRQMEAYFRKKGQEFEAQKKKLAEANAWIQEAEKRLKSEEEERLRMQNQVEELQLQIQDLRNPAPSQPISITPTTPFSFMNSTGTELISRSFVNSTPNSSFNMHSPLVNSLNEPDYNVFFDNTTAAVGSVDSLFNTMSSNGQQTISDSAAFSNTFNNMFSSLKEGDKTTNQTMSNKTSNSMENWRGDYSHDASRRETSLPLSSAHHQQVLRRNTQHGLDRGPIRDLRRYSSQPGYLAHRKSIRSNNYLDG